MRVRSCGTLAPRGAPIGRPMRDEVVISSGPGPRDGRQVVGNDPEPDPALHASRATVSASTEPMTALQRADAAFAPGPPPQGRPRRARATFVLPPRQHNVTHPVGLRPAFVRARSKPAIGHRELGGM